jgi:hypothetical protein
VGLYPEGVEIHMKSKNQRQISISISVSFMILRREVEARAEV